MKPAPVTTISQATTALRVKQMLVATMIGACSGLIICLGSASWDNVRLIAVALTALAAAWVAILRGHFNLCVKLTMVTLTSMVTALVWQNGGLADEAMLAYPGILVLAGIFGTRGLVVTMLSLIVSIVIAIVAANQYGWHVTTPPQANWSSCATIISILGVTGVTVWLMARDLRQALVDLEGENQRVRDSQQRLEFVASHDALTELPNRSFARELFATQLAAARRRHHKAALLYIDLDNFKSVNDSLGHSAGDKLLWSVGKRLRAALRDSDMVCRVGGDEFLILVGDLNDADGAAEVARKALEQFATAFELEGFEFNTACSIGIAVFPDDGADFDALLKSADTAMYCAKEEGGGTFRFFNADMNTGVLEHLHLTTALRTGLTRGEFVLYYQPKIELLSGRIIGAEALIRWKHPELGLVPPARFIPIAEKSGIIVPLGEWVLREACAQARRWCDEGLGELSVAVNVSPVQFRHGEIDHVVLDTLKSSGLPPQRLEVEVTESLLLDLGNTAQALQRLRRAGVRVALDDFGTGYSSLSYLRRIAVDCLKIDQSFVRRISTDRQDEAIVRAVIKMAGSLNLTTIAEGVEDGQTLDRLVTLGCHAAQGYLWSPPLPAGEFTRFVRSRSGPQSSDVPQLAAPPKALPA